ncbi:hypothetical protein [Acinetobacter sp.]|uniref:hypothetical protein n=1 Tax=Acinetobacter sp. TaxID=472 RepID=UPI0025862252|nr:hypothetical protein [Acinetobacter sp.]
MFRKGIVIFYDEKSAKGLIELKNDHQQVVFKLEDFSNQTVLPQLGERIKCVVLEQNGEVLAKFIVRLDHKNYVTDPTRSLPVLHLYEENVYENLRKARKAHKKRRLIAEDDSYSPIARHSEQNTATALQSQFAYEIIQTQSASLQNEKFERINPRQSAQEITAPVHVKDIQPNAATAVFPNLPLTEEIELTKNKQNLNELDAVENYCNVESFNTFQVTQKEQPVQKAKRVGLLDFTYVNQMPERNENHDQQQPIEQHQVIEQQPKSDIDADLPMAITSETVGMSHLPDQKVLQQHIGLNGLQRFYQNIKIQFLYAKRTQPKKKTASEAVIRLNPWIVIIGIVLFIGVNCVMYAMDRYKQYKIESAMKLQQYQQQQKDAIKQQKREAYSR